MSTETMTMMFVKNNSNTAPFSRAFGAIRTDLTRRGTPIGPYDLQIAAIALANNCVLVTHNTGEFSRIAGLKLEDWEVEK